MADELAEVERLAGAILRNLSSAERGKILRRMGIALAGSQRRRIAAQRAPDGTPFEPRKEKQQGLPSRGATCFLYPSGGSGGSRRVIMKSFTWGTGRMMTGFDIEAGAIRSFDFDKVIKWLPVPDEHRNKATGGRLRRRSSLRRKAMFRRLASARFLRAGVDNQGMWVGFTGQASRIADIHHSGLRDRPSLRGNAIRYPKRELLGATPDDREMLLDLLFAHVSVP